MKQILKHRKLPTDEQLDEIQKKDLLFQALSWYEGDFDLPNQDDDDEDEEPKKEYQIYVHGVTAQGLTVCLRIMKFVPYFYVMIPSEFQDQWDDNLTNVLFKYLRKRLGKNSYGLVTKTTVEKCKLYPFENLKKYKVIRLGFRTNTALNKCRYILKYPLRVYGLSTDEIKFEMYESNLHSMLRFTHIRNIRMAGWIKIKQGDYDFEEDEISRAQLNVTVNYRDVHPSDKTDIAPFVILSYDLECQSSRGYPEFPEPEIDGDYISQIGCTLWEFGENTKKHQIVFTCKKADPIDEAIIVNCKSEENMFKEFCDFVGREDPDIFTGYNTWGFDDKYLWIRMTRYDLDPYIDKLGRIIDKPPELKEKQLSSGAYGHNSFKVLYMPGRETFDVIVAIRREHKLESFKLKNVSIHFKLPQKIDLAYEELFKILERDIPSEISKVCEYCAHDALLPILIIEKLCMVPNYIEMAKSTRVPVDWLLFRGQQCKVFSQMVYEARLKGFITPVFEKSNVPGDKFKGATVLHAFAGAYYEPIAGLDFKSLYPSIMISENMCYSTLVIDKKYMNLPGIEYQTIQWNEEEQNREYAFTFVQNIKGVLPGILEKLWAERNATKREMKKARGTFLEKVLNGKQLAIKVTMNSIYGFTGAGNGMLPCRPIAASVTAKGRQLIAETSKLVQEMYSCTTVYGDSVPNYQRVLVKLDDKVTKIPIGDLYDQFGDEWEYQNDGRTKLQKLIDNPLVMAWTASGWKKLRRVIRHKTRKKLYRIKTDKGEVVVTADHSLIGLDGNQIKPEDLKIGGKLMWKEFKV